MNIPTSFGSLFTWLVYFGLTATIIVLDGKRQRAIAHANGAVDFADRRIVPYLVLGVLCGPLPLIFYFGITRKTAAGWLLGIGAAIAVSAITGVVAAVLNAGPARPHF